MNILSVTYRQNNIPFNSRHLEIHEPEKFPPKLLQSIQDSKALNAFICAGKPKTWWEQIADFFKRDEYLDLYYDKYTGNDIFYTSVDELVFDMGKYIKNKVWRSERGLTIRAVQKEGGSNPEERILKKVEEINDFNKELTSEFHISEV